MRKTIMIWALTATCAGMFLSCGNRNAANGKAGDWQWEEVSKDTATALGTAEGSPKAEIHLRLLQFKNKEAALVNAQLLKCGMLMPDYLSASNDGDFRSAVDTFVTRYLNDYRKDYGEMYRRDNSNPNTYQVQYACDTQVKVADKHIVNYVADIYYYGGGAHGVSTRIVRNINTKTGKILTPQDVFTTDYESSIVPLIIEELCKQFKVKNLEQLQAEAGVFTDMEPYMPDNFMLGDDSITFIYGDTEIAPHALGIIEVTVDRDDLKPYLK